MADPDSAAFHLEEYKSLRQEVDVRIRELNTLSIYCVTGQLAGFAFLLTLQFGTTFHVISTSVFRIIAWLLLAFPVFGFLKAMELKLTVETISKYIAKIEDVYRYPILRGWEHVMRDERDGIDIEGRRISIYRKIITNITYYPLWIVCFL